MTTDRFCCVDREHTLTVNIVLAMIALRQPGVLPASVDHRENPVKSMFSGNKRQRWKQNRCPTGNADAGVVGII